MSIRGWVYVLSNKAMPKLVKVGFSTKDPALRVEELNTTGMPHSFVVEYDVLVLEPREVEQAVHLELLPHHEAKEFFRVEVRQAVAAIRTVIARQGKAPIAETLFTASDTEDDCDPPQRCSICQTNVLESMSRCPKCFALLS